MLLLPLDRQQLLHFLPQGGEVAEIGVCQGEFSRPILDIVQPKRLHLIDSWAHSDDPAYGHDVSNVADGDHHQRFQAVSAAFAEPIATGQVRILRQDSAAAAGEFADGQLDWVYVDALHTAEGVSRDLAAYAAKVNQGGFILGHDYTNQPAARRMNFGVVEAVNAFVLGQGWHFAVLTIEEFPTYVLTRDASHPAIQLLLAKLLYNLPLAVEIRGFPASASFEHRLFQPGGVPMLVPSF